MLIRNDSWQKAAILVKRMKIQTIDELPVIGRLRHLFLSATVKCYRVEHLLSLYIDGELSDKLAREVEEHLEECASCKAAKAVLTATHQALTARTEVQPPAYLSERLRQALAIEMSRPTPIKQSSPWITIPRLAYAGTSIAALTLFAVIALHHGGLGPVSRPTGPGTVAVIPSSIGSHRPSKPTVAPIKRLVLEATVPGENRVSKSPLTRTIPLDSGIDLDRYANKTEIRTVISNSHFVAFKSNVRKSNAKSSSLDPQIASNGGRTTPTDTDMIPVTPITPDTQVLPDQPTGQQQVASTNNVPAEQPHGNLYGALHMHDSSLFTQSTEHTVQPIQNELQPADYAPGEQIVGSKI
jgi:hypothetical protein